MPHFYAIAMYRLDDYAAAKIPVLPIVKGPRHTKTQILFYIAAFILANVALSLLGYTGYIYLIVMVLLGIAWFWLGIKGFKIDNKKWARKMFYLSLIVILSLSVMLSIGSRIA
jgi:protoheme IX farnesyltransferase